MEAEAIEAAKAAAELNIMEGLASVTGVQSPAPTRTAGATAQNNGAAMGAVSPIPSAPASASPSGTNASNPDYTSCARRYGELVRDLTLAGGIEPSDAQRWSGQAEEAATKAEQGDLDGALAICEQTVSEMQAALDGS